MKKIHARRVCAALCLLLLPSTTLLAQAPALLLTAPSTDSPRHIAQRYLQQDAQRRQLDAGDLEYRVEDESRSALTGVTHVSFQQTIDSIPVRHGLTKVNVMPDGRVLSASNGFAAQVAQRASRSTPSLSAADAVERAARHMGVSTHGVSEKAPLRVDHQTLRLFSGGAISGDQDIGATLVYEKTRDSVRLAWQVLVNRYESRLEVMEIRIDAHTGEVLGADNVVQFEGEKNATPKARMAPQAAGYNSVYRVFAQPFESPESPGAAHALLTNPADATASPFGWHDTRANPSAGQPEYTNTRGNNVFAQYDLASSNSNSNPRPAGVWDATSGTLTFDYPWNANQPPFTEANAQAATVNLFYWNNLIHDVMLHYGFDEAAGNFQKRNYNSGLNSSPRNNDEVHADALDGATNSPPNLNNANFLPVPEEFFSQLFLGKPRMQMYRWGAPGAVEVTSPFSDQYQAAPAAFGATLSAALPGEIVLVASSGSSTPEEGCETPYANAAEVNGKIALIKRGSCEFHRKVAFAEQNGAIAAIVYNNAGDQTIAMGEGEEGHSVTISSAFIGQPGGEAIVTALGDGPVEGALLPPGDAGQDRDSDFDAGIITHEYAHGISNRLSGRTTLNCHSGDEQQGEGWSDFYGLIFTLTPQVCEVPRGIGTYASFQPATGPGIRRYPYTPDMNVNPFTFADIADEQQTVPHGVGSVWATMLWDMSCKLMVRHGVNPDIYARDAGNGIALRLVSDGLRIGSCSPTFVQSRNNILAADAAIEFAEPGYEDNKCLIWRSFARRGLGLSAQSGSASSRSDQTEAFDVPAECVTHVDTSAGAGGTISPAGPIALHFDQVLSVDVLPDPGFQIDTVTGCEGSLDGTIYTTGLIKESCEITASFVPDVAEFAVTPVVIGNGSFDPGGVQHIAPGATVSFTLIPATGHHLVDVEGCDGSLAGNVYTTGFITADCTVTATFAIDTFQIDTVVNGTGGSISPSGPISADFGSQPVLTLIADSGYALDQVSGCNGVLDGLDYTLAPVAADCTVEASFRLLPTGIFSDGFESQR